MYGGPSLPIKKKNKNNKNAKNKKKKIEINKLKK